MDYPEWWEEYGQHIEEKAVLAAAAYAIGCGQSHQTEQAEASSLSGLLCGKPGPECKYLIA